MKHSWKILPLTGLALTALGCSNEQPAPTPPASEMPIRLSVIGVDSHSDGSRALIGPEDKPDDWVSLQKACTPAPTGLGKAIGIYADFIYTNANGNEVTVSDIFKDTKLVYDASMGGNPHSSWNYEEDKYWLMGGEYKFNAYFPQEMREYVLKSSDATTLVIEYASHKVQEDLLIAYNSVNTKNITVNLGDPVPLHFYHALAALRFRIQAADEESGALTACWFESSKTEDFAQGRILAFGSKDNPFYYTWTDNYSPTPGDRFFRWANNGVPFSTVGTERTPAYAYTKEGTTQGELYVENNSWILIPPQESTGDLSFCFTMAATGDAIYRVKIPQKTGVTADGADDNEFRSGKRYTYTISISVTDLELTLSVNDWNMRESSYQITF